MPLIDKNAKTNWAAVFGLLLVCSFFLLGTEWPRLALVPLALAGVLGLGFVSNVVIDMVRGIRNWIGELRESFVEVPVEIDAPEPAPALAAPLAVEPARVRAVCPRCDEWLSEAGGSFDERRCPRGHGALLAAHASERLLVERARLDLEVVRELAREHGAERVRCGSCGKMMRETRLRSIPVDLCLSCGSMWLDDKELGALDGAKHFASE